MAPGWALEAAGERLLVHAGADHLFAIEEVQADVAGEVVALWEGAPDGRQALSERGAEIVDQLVLVGALRPAIGTDGAVLAVELRFSGRPLDMLAAALTGALEGGSGRGRTVLASEPDADLLLLVRTAGTLKQAAESMGEGPRRPCLFADVAYHHTISLGPLVVPGDTACLTCLAGRVRSAWGDAAPPAEPLAARNVVLLAGLLANELAKVAAGDRGLANRTVAFDLEQLRLVDETLLKHPWCPACGRPAVPAGPVAVSWGVGA